MNVHDLFNWIVLFATPVLTVLGIYIQNRRSRKTETTEANNDQKHLEIKQQDSETRTFAALTESFNDQVRGLREDNKQLNIRYNELLARYDILESKFEAAMAHVNDLEMLVPVPPGAPKRPWVH